MKLRRNLMLVFAATALWLPEPAHAWWDTRIIAQRPIPLIKEYPAAQCAGGTVDAIRQDAQANGGQSGKVVAMPPGGAPLQVEFKVPRGIYCLWLVARADQPFDAENAPPASITLTVTPKATGAPRRWTMPAYYLDTYQAIAQIYFPADWDGDYTAAMSLDASSKMSLLVDRLELRDALGDVARRAVKTRRMLTNDAELAQLREAAAQATDKSRYFAAPGAFGWSGHGNMPARTAQQRAADAGKLWDAVPDFNVTMEMAASDSPYRWIMGAGNANGAINSGARLYQSFGDPEAAWNGAVLLCGLARKYPGLDLRVQGVGGVGFHRADSRFSFSDGVIGKYMYCGWATPELMDVSRAYDQLFDFINGNQELADFVGTKIPWVKTPQDVVALIDTQLVQCGMDAWHRRQLENSDEVGSLLPLIEGPGDVSRRMLDLNLFGRADFGMTDAGGVDDQIFSANSDDGLRYIGSSYYATDELGQIVQEMHRYVLAGGDPKYDLLDPTRYPQVGRAAYATEAFNVAGGFPLIIGDARDLHVGRIDDKVPAYPSRVLGGFGVAILEDGQNAANPSAKRAVAVRTGIGVGHAHQDTLNLDINALGCRLAADLGGRDEGANRGWPNMRHNRCHNLVEVDGHEFMNNVRGSSTTSGTGWTRWFDPAPGCQAMTNMGRATSHPNVSLYERTTAMIDGPVTADRAPIYVFDVFRVAGGKEHTFCFHGAESGGMNAAAVPDAPPEPGAAAAIDTQSKFTGKSFDTNVVLQPATGDAAAYLAGHKDGTRQQGVIGDDLEADWRLNDNEQKAWVGDMDEGQRRHTRLSVLGQSGATLLVGNAHSDQYKYDFPFLYVQKKQNEDGMQNAFVSLVETYAGTPFIASKKLLAVTPKETDARAGVGVEVTLKNGRRDTIFASGHPDRDYTLANGATANGEFAFASTDAQGLRQMQLVGGTHLRAGDAAIEADTAQYTGKITGVDYEHRQLTIDAAIPPETIAGEVALIGNDRHVMDFNTKGAAKVPGGTRIDCVETPEFYQSKILVVDGHGVIPELEPAAIRADSDYYEGATAGNARGTAFWKMHVISDERFMNIGWPGYRTSVLNAMTMKDLPDAGTPGGATLRMMSPATKAHPQGEEMLVMHVTHVDENAGTFYFKMPDQHKYQTGGWQFNGNTLVNSDGSKSWRSLYAGSSYRFLLNGPAPVDEATFATPGATPKLLVYHYGPGDQFTLPAHVAVTRTAPGEYEIRANVACAITLPVTGQFERKVAEGKWVALASKSGGHATTIRIASDMLTGEPIAIRMK